jgi:hypothetical protein
MLRGQTRLDAVRLATGLLLTAASRRMTAEAALADRTASTGGSNNRTAMKARSRRDSATRKWRYVAGFLPQGRAN